MTWWFEGADLVAVWGPGETVLGAPDKDLKAKHGDQVDAVLDAIEGKVLRVSGLPSYVAAAAEGRDIRGFEPNGLFFVEANENASGILESVLSPIQNAQSGEQIILQTLGLARARQVVGRWGFRGKSLVTDLRFVAPEPWKGVVGLFDPRGFLKENVPPIPRGYGAFAIGSFRSGDVNQAFAPILGVLEPEPQAILDAAEKAVDDATTEQFRERCFATLDRNGACTQHLAGTMAPGRRAYRLS